MIIYIAGPITGIVDYKKIFKAAEKKLTTQGHIVWNPAYAPVGLDYDSYFPVCFAMIDTCDAIYMLPGWEQSKGAIKEHDYAKEKELEIYIAGIKEPESTKKSKKKSESDILFDKFWKAYPKKIAKPKALLAWRKINPDEKLLDKILDSINRQVKTENWLKDGGQFIPYPATYLNQNRWEDTIEINLPEANESSFDINDLELAVLQKYIKK